jgi:hypothetical protein
MTTVIAQELWRSESHALHDLTMFIDEHGPGADVPLPLLHWRVGPSHTVHAEIHSLDREHGGGHRDPRTVIAAYSGALGTRIVEHPDEESVLLVADGRIGPPKGADAAGRTQVVIRARVPTQNHKKIGGRAFLP